MSGLYNASGASEVDVEAAAADETVGEGKFYIDPQGDGSFATTTARCFRAVIHRYGIQVQAAAAQEYVLEKSWFTTNDPTIGYLR